MDYIESGKLLCPWKEHKEFLREEENRERLLTHNNELGYSENSPLANALSHVFESVGENDLLFYRGVLRTSPEALDRVRTRAGIKMATNSPYSYTDRKGKVQLPFDEALDLARKFNAAEPPALLLGIETTEREWAQKARTPSDEYIIPSLNEYRAAFALIRQWTGHDPAIAALIERRDLISFNDGPLPPPGTDMGGLSGGPVLLVDGINYPNVGVVTDRCDMSFAEVEILKFATLADVRIDPS